MGIEGFASGTMSPSMRGAPGSDESTGDITFGNSDDKPDDDKSQSQRVDPVWGTINNPGKWLRDLNNTLWKEMSEIGDAYGMSPMEVNRLFQQHIGGLNDQLVNHFMPTAANYAAGYGTTPVSFYTETKAGAEYLADYGRRWLEGKISGLDFSVDLPGPGSGRTGSRGSAGPTAEDIRAAYDLDELAKGANTLWQGWLLEDAQDPRGMARAYVDAIVSTGGKQKIDFTEFIRGRAKDTSRWASVYGRKPESMTEEQFLQPYFQAASQLINPRDAANVAIQGAQFGASAQQFNERLKREDSVTGSAPFINSMQEKMGAVSGILKG